MVLKGSLYDHSVGYSKLVRQKYSNCFYLQSLMITKGQIQVSIRIKAEAG